MTTSALPPDRSDLTTEQRHDASSDFDALTAERAAATLIDDQHTAVRAVHARSADLGAVAQDVADALRSGGRLIYVGAGTSGRLGVLDASECPPTFGFDPAQVIGIIAGGDAALRVSSEAREDDPRGVEPIFDDLDVNDRDVVIAIAAGGTTPYALGALELADDRGATTVLLSCASPRATPDRTRVIVLETGPEILTGSTRLKAGTATKIALNTITTVAAALLGKMHGNLMIDLRATNDKLVDRALRILRWYCPDLTRDAAFTVLESAHRELRTAIVMQRRGVDAEAARELLAAHDGQLRAVIGDSVGRLS